ncbi:MAG TPA: hypothetical protein VNS99_01800 [Gaiellales bacterium]|nr:hypothetical protein [Gaiellales bacterium]
MALMVILAAVAAGCGLGGGSGAGSTGAATVRSTAAGPPYHSVVVRGTHTFSTDDLALPLTVHCPQSGPGGFTQVLNDPWKAGMNGIYHGANGSGMVFAVDESGNVRISC